MSDHLGWGVIGCGWVGRDLAAPAIATAANARLVALHDPDGGRLASAAARHPDAALCTELDALLAHPDVDAVYIATPNHTHATLTAAAAAAGRHVLCEKPMATTGADARAMVAACATAGVTYATAFDQRHHGAHRRLARLVADGALGTVTLVRIHYACWLAEGWTPWPGQPHDNWRLDPARAGGGALVDLAPHGIDLVPVLLGGDIAWDTLSAITQSRVHAYAVDDGAALAGRLTCGTLAVMTVAYNCPDALPRRRLELYGTAALAEAVDTMGQTPGGTLTLTDGVSGERQVVRIAPEDDRSPFLHQIEAFGAAVLGGVPLASTPERDASHVELLEASWR